MAQRTARSGPKPAADEEKAGEHKYTEKSQKSLHALLELSCNVPRKYPPREYPLNITFFDNQMYKIIIY
jgi:hypothetical protein